MSIWDLAAPGLRDLAPYEPGKPIEEVAREVGLPASEIIKLASNENPLGPSPKAVAAMQKALGQSQLYPDGGCFHLRQALSKKLQVSPSQLIFGCGSNEIIELIFHAFLSERNASVVASQYAFIVYKLLCQLFGARYIEVPAKHFAHDLDAMHAAIQKDTRAICITTPNNPTGTRIPNQELQNFIRSIPPKIIIVLDEAYYEYLENPPATVEWLHHHPNLILSRTFSKIHGLAGLRLGYGILSPDTTQILQRCRQPFNTTTLAQVAAVAALDDADHAAKTKALNTKTLKRLIAFFKEQGLETVPSEANFVMVKVGDGTSIFQKLLSQGVIIRPLGGYGLRQWVRISTGTEEEMKRLEKAWGQI